MDKQDASIRSLEVLIRERLGETVKSVKPIEDGVNSHTIRMACESGRVLLSKIYINRPGDSTDRLGTEFSALEFLWRNGIRNVPQPLLSDPGSNTGVYSFIEGTKLKPGEVDEGGVDEAAAFVSTLHGLRNAHGADGLPFAKESCFTLAAYLEVMAGRIKKLGDIDSSDEAGKALSGFLSDRFLPEYELIRERLCDGAKEVGIGLEAELPLSERTLSQSDFGFQNIIKLPEGGLSFIDFEYFGWDDPVKLISDFFLEPAVPVPVNLRLRFLEAIAPLEGAGGELRTRLGLVYPVLALKWCLIILNVFLHSPMVYNTKDLMLRLQRADERLNALQKELKARSFPLGQEIM